MNGSSVWAGSEIFYGLSRMTRNPLTFGDAIYTTGPLPFFSLSNPGDVLATTFLTILLPRLAFAFDMIFDISIQ